MNTPVTRKLYLEPIGTDGVGPRVQVPHVDILGHAGDIQAKPDLVGFSYYTVDSITANGREYCATPERNGPTFVVGRFATAEEVAKLPHFMRSLDAGSKYWVAHNGSIRPFYEGTELIARGAAASGLKL